MTATQELEALWNKMKKEGNCKSYVLEMCSQLELLGTETNTLTKNMVKNQLKDIIKKIEATEKEF